MKKVFFIVCVFCCLLFLSSCGEKSSKVVEYGYNSKVETTYFNNGYETIEYEWIGGIGYRPKSKETNMWSSDGKKYMEESYEWDIDKKKWIGWSKTDTIYRLIDSYSDAEEDERVNIYVVSEDPYYKKGYFAFKYISYSWDSENDKWILDE